MAETANLTARQRQVLEFVVDQQRQTGLVPTLQETANHFGFKSPNSVRQHLRLIEKKGFVRRIPRRSRGLVVTRPDSKRAHVGALPVEHRAVGAAMDWPTPVAAAEGVSEAWPGCCSTTWKES